MFLSRVQKIDARGDENMSLSEKEGMKKMTKRASPPSPKLMNLLKAF